jgi:hypothetical protein
MNAKDFAKLVALAVAVYGGYSAWQAWEKQEDVRNGVMLIAAGVSVYTAFHKL